MVRCLVVDDDTEIRNGVQALLAQAGLQADTAATAAAMQQAVRAQAFDVIVLDLMLPDGNGLALCRWLQEAQPSAAVLMLTAQGDPMSRVLGLELGADDYLAKPFEPRELVARVQALQRRRLKSGGVAAPATPAEPARWLGFEGWRFDRLLRQLESPEGLVLALSSAEFRLLAAFVERPGRPLSRDQLIELTRAPGVEVNDRSIDLAVSRLRSKLGDNPPRLICTLRGQGYVFNAQPE